MHSRIVTFRKCTTERFRDGKFGYLKDSLEGEPAGLLGGMILDDDGYEEAWQRLCKRYEDGYALARIYLNQLYLLPSLKPPVTASKLKHMSNVACQAKRQLRSLGFPVDEWNFIFVPELHKVGQGKCG